MQKWRDMVAYYALGDSKKKGTRRNRMDVFSSPEDTGRTDSLKNEGVR